MSHMSMSTIPLPRKNRLVCILSAALGPRTPLRLLTIIGCLLCMLANGAPVLAGDSDSVGFDVPAVVVAERIDPAVVPQPSVGGKFIRLRFPVSTYVPAGFPGEVLEYVVEFESRNESVRMIDFWPRNEVFSQIAGKISVENSHQTDANLQASVTGGLEPFARGSLAGEFQRKSSVNERYERLPPMQSLTSSGTLARGYGVFFKFRPGPSPDLEGSRSIAILAEVPFAWRADMLHVRMTVTGKSSSSSFKQRVLARTQMWMTVHQEGDLAAAAQARRFVTQERTLRALAASRAKEVAQKSMPTIFHKLGAAIDVVEPRIPADYLNQVIFGPATQYLEGDSHRLPIDLRIAILDYWDAREALASLAFYSATDEYSVARRDLPNSSREEPISQTDDAT